MYAPWISVRHSHCQEITLSLSHKNGPQRFVCFLAILCRIGGSIANSKHHYIWGRLNFHSIADYIGKKNLSQKCGGLRFIELCCEQPYQIEIVQV
jgi:hypothetical protein